MTRTYALSVLFVAIAAIPAQAITINPQHDAFVRSNSPTSSFGADNQLQLKNDPSASVNRKTYVKYDLPTLIGPDFFSNALLDLTFIASGAGSGLTGSNQFSVYGLNDGNAGESWSQASITWNNAPANNTANGTGITSDATLLGTFNLTGQTGNVLFSGSGGAAVTDFLNNSVSDELVTFIIVRETPSTTSSIDNYVHAIASLESGTPGALLQFDITSPAPIPEPSSALLLMLGLVGFRAMRRRQR